jgi:hypothetical protein
VRNISFIFRHPFLTAGTTRVSIGAGSALGPQFPEDRLAGLYIWMWIAICASATLYIPLYFWAKGFWSIDEEYKFHWWNADQGVGYLQRRATLGMLL